MEDSAMMKSTAEVPLDKHISRNRHKKFKHLTWGDRCKLEAYLEDHHSVAEISELLGCSTNTVRNELKKGRNLEGKYIPYVAQIGYVEARKNCHRRSKFKEAFSFLKIVIDLFNEKKWSIEICVKKAACPPYNFTSKVSFRTVYQWLYEGRIVGLKRIIGRGRAKGKGKRICNHKLFNGGLSISKRPVEVLERKVFGHWEIDTVIGQKTGSNQALLTLTERKTCFTIVKLLPQKDMSSVNDALRDIFKEYGGDRVAQVFKSITADNGREFAAFGHFCSKYGVKGYYAHPYASYERAINERQNRILRRYVPKGYDMNLLTEEMVELIFEEMNAIPRQMFNLTTPEELFDQGLDEIFIAA